MKRDAYGGKSVIRCNKQLLIILFQFSLYNNAVGNAQFKGVYYKI